MRYYNFTMNANAEQIKEKTTINLREYAYENPIAAMNNYMYKNMKNDLSFYAYREDGSSVFAAFMVLEENDYGNGRYVRKTLEEAEMNLAERVLQYKQSEITTELITIIEESDIPSPNIKKKTIRRMGFAS